MSNVSENTSFVKKIAPALITASLGLLLSACTSGWRGEVDDVYVPVSHTERYPIEVVKGTVRVNVPTKSSRMSAGQIDAVTRFAQQANSSGASRITIARPGGSINGDVIAGRITQIFNEQGIKSSLLRHSTFSGRRGAPVSLSFSRKFAKTKKCGNWTEDFSVSGDNLPHADFGCSNQHNLAAQIANPNDFVTPRTSTPIDPMRRQQVITDYRTPKSPSTPADASSTVSTTNSGKT